MQEIKAQVRDNILFNISNYVDGITLDTIQHIIEEQFVNLDIRAKETLPAVVDSSTDEQNNYILGLFEIKKKNLTPETRRAYRDAIKRLLTQVDKPLTEVTDIDISFYLHYYETYRERQGRERNQPTSVNNEKRFLSAFFTFMRKAKLITENPVEGIENLKTEEKPIDYFKGAELETLRAGCKNLRDRALVEGLRSTGLRVGEFEALNRDSINWLTGDVTVKRQKGGRTTPAYLDDTAMFYMQQYLNDRADDNPALIAGTRHPFKRLEKAGIRSVLKVIAQRQGAKFRVYPHKMRKTLGMTMINKGEDLGTVQAVLGHTSPATTSRFYAQLTPESLREVRRRTA